MGVAGVFSLEMSKEQLFMRMLSSEAKIDSFRAAQRPDRPARVRPDHPRHGDAVRGAALRRRLGRRRRARDARQGAAAAGRARPRHPGRRLRAADDRARPLREPHPRTGVDLAIAQGPGQGAERPDHRAVAAVARARSAIRQAADAVGPARIGRAGAGCRRGHHDLPRRDVQARSQRAVGDRRHRRAHPRQAAQRPDRHREDGLHRGADQVHAPGRGRGGMRE